MSLTRLKAIAWALAALAGVSLAAYVIQFLGERDEIAQTVSQEDMLGVLASVPEPKAPKVGPVAYDTVHRGVALLNWTGKVDAPKISENTITTPPPPPPKKGIADLLEVLFLRADLEEPDLGMVYVRYKEPPLMKGGDKARLVVGDHLPATYQKVYLKSVRPEGALFAWEDGEGDEALLLPVEADSTYEIIQVGTGEAVMPPRIAFPQSPNRSPGLRYEHITPVGPNHYVVGTKDAAELSENYAEIIAREVRTARWRNPGTGRYEGIEVKDVATGSKAAQFGIKAGDVIKSINGQPVTSTSDAITFVKKEAQEKVVEKWYVVVDSKGKEKTIVIDTPATE